ncbi:Integrin alpha-E [Galemys pyrenaicus]|uniref:Integrin alpha-E n=1 Tax=Galemys pyrenaicus TaxID=202257 RepID=A0A8J6ACW7_GALPY|nr:Integrin alpha-E [Galemys pyrenaicus]
MDPLNLITVINSPQMEGVERFAIGVGAAFNSSKAAQELNLIASDPDDTHAFKVDNYKVLDEMLSKLQQNILRMEGMVGDALHYQLAQIGFSAQILNERTVLLGAVGAFDWSGGVLLYDLQNQQGHFLNQTEAEAKAAPYSYLGYAVAVLHRACRVSCMAGAPRHRQRGAVFELQKEGQEANFMPVLEGEQMGSYFGSELCPVDIDMDGTTDFLLVAAPFYHIHGEEGRVYVYRLNEVGPSPSLPARWGGGSILPWGLGRPAGESEPTSPANRPPGRQRGRYAAPLSQELICSFALQDASFSLAHMLSGSPGFASARFGFAMATVGDVNQDKFTDVAIGAPLEGSGEDDGTSFGTVYIYNGRQSGLNPCPSQRIRASQVAQGLHHFRVSLDSGLHHFGVSLDGGLDVTGDGLADITVGALGQAVVLRSRPVVLLRPSVNFTPEALPIGFSGSVGVSLCFEVGSATTAAESALRGTSLNVTLDVDVAKDRKRWQCSDKGACQRHLGNWSSELHFCQFFQLIPTEAELCEEDCFSNISVKVSYQLHAPEDPGDLPQPVLDFYTEPFALFQVTLPTARTTTCGCSSQRQQEGTGVFLGESVEQGWWGWTIGLILPLSVWLQLPYEKDCENKLFCNADLRLNSTISQQDLVVGFTKELVMNIDVENSGEDSYMTTMTLNYPRNLQFKSIQKPPSSNIQCANPKPAASTLDMNCKIAHPIFKNSSANISVVWQLEEIKFPDRTANITVTVTNSNERKSLVVKNHSLQFRHAFVAHLPKPSVMYVTTSRGSSDRKEFLFNVSA